MKKTKNIPKKKNKAKKQELAGTKAKLTIKKHLIPPLAGLFVAFLVFGFFNSQYISGRIAYYFNEKHANTAVADSNTSNLSLDPNAQPRIIINKINVKAPVIFDETKVNEGSFQLALRHGVVHYPNTALPGHQGNIVIFGHSSGQWWAPGDYKFVFTLLDKLSLNDRIFIEYKGTRYIYKVYDLTVVKPEDLSVVNQGSGNKLTLITCTPVGTSYKRLIVRAEQIVPKVNKEDSTLFNQSAKLPANAQGNLPGNSGSFWGDLKELLNL